MPSVEATQEKEKPRLLPLLMGVAWLGPGDMSPRGGGRRALRFAFGLRMAFVLVY